MIGRKCFRCGELVLTHEQDDHYPGQPMHVECGARGIIGGLNHLRGTCTCCGGTDDPDPPDVSKREAARLALVYWRSLTVTQREDIVLREVRRRTD
jgi:hypothetical protein